MSGYALHITVFTLHVILDQLRFEQFFLPDACTLFYVPAPALSHKIKEANVRVILEYKLSVSNTAKILEIV
ncbi:hypothetical protein J6590_057963 [Homalodisca vitripennis]|nr:hypothetical protein J6590_057963 [Homalodisca vitripennis]